jgi:hypothetical protein
LRVDAAVPASIAGDSERNRLLALAGDGLWVLDYESRLGRRRVGAVIACWARRGLIAHLEHTARGNWLELSWPRNCAFVRAATPHGQLTDRFVGHLIADELSQQIG